MVVIYGTLTNGEDFTIGYTEDLNYFVHWNEELGEKHEISNASNSRKSNKTDALVAGLFIPADSETIAEVSEVTQSEVTRKGAEDEEDIVENIESARVVSRTVTTSVHPNARRTPFIAGWTDATRSNYRTIPAESILTVGVKEAN